MYSQPVMLNAARRFSPGALCAIAVLISQVAGCAATNPYAGIFSAGSSGCGAASTLESQGVGGECLMQQREAYEQALGELTVQVLR